MALPLQVSTTPPLPGTSAVNAINIAIAALTHSGIAMGNGKLVASVAANILTVAVKTINGVDPSSIDPVVFVFRNATAATGDFSAVLVTAPLSIATIVGATQGAANTVPFRLWVTAFNNAGAVVLALFQSVTGGANPTAIAPLNESAVQSTVAMSAGATSAGVFYTPSGTTLASKAFRIIGHLDFASGLATAGSYASGPTTIHLFGPGDKKPGDVVQLKYMETNTVTSVTTNVFVATTLLIAIAPTSAMNLIRAAYSCVLSAAHANELGQSRLYRGATPIGPLGAIFDSGSSVEGVSTLVGDALDAPQTVASTNYGVRIANILGSNAVSLPPNSGYPTSMSTSEIMV